MDRIRYFDSFEMSRFIFQITEDIINGKHKNPKQLQNEYLDSKLKKTSK